MYLNPCYTALAREESHLTYMYIDLLTRHGVCGTMKQHTFELVRTFLDKHLIEYRFNNDGTIWMPQLPDTLQTIFQINRPI